MKWKYPKDGDKRERIIFAFMPHYCEDGLAHWLERIKIEEQYDSDYYDSGWTVIKAHAL